MNTIYILFILFVSLINGQIAFPEEDPLTSAQNRDARQPFFVPGMCPDNQLYYPGDQQSDWVCDCAPSFVYYPTKDACFHVYKQGPCKVGEYLILKKPQVIPECVRNPCVNDTTVPFNGKCLKLHRSNGCPRLELGGGTLEVNPATLQLECIPGNAAELNIIQFPNASCPLGSKRSATGRCRAEF